MPDAVRFTLSDGTAVLVAPPARAGTDVVGLGTRLENAGHTLRQALAPITSAATDVIGEFRALAHRPDEVEITFGVVLDAKLGALIAGASTSAHLDVTLRWNGAEGQEAEAGSPGQPGRAAGEAGAGSRAE
jgi:hypothetical protein